MSRRPPAYLPLALLLLLTACSESAQDAGDGQGAVDPPPPAPTVTDDLPRQNQGNRDIYSPDPEDPYEIDEDNSFMGLRPGYGYAAYLDLLREGRWDYGGESFPAWYIDGADGEELGYVQPAPSGDEVRTIVITSPNVVTHQGLRVGLTRQELQQRLGALREVVDEVTGGVGVFVRPDRVYRLDESGVVVAVVLGS